MGSLWKGQLRPQELTLPHSNFASDTPVGKCGGCCLALVLHIGSLSRNYRFSQQDSNLEKNNSSLVEGISREMVKRRKTDVSEAGKKGTEG